MGRLLAFHHTRLSVNIVASFSACLGFATVANADMRTPDAGEQPLPDFGLQTSDSPWRPLPVFGGGFVLNALIAPSDPSRWYTYVDIGGPYRSDDGGATWRPLHAAMPLDMRAVWADHVRGLSIDPRDADSFVMASGDRFAEPAGIYVTHDGGRTFRRAQKARFYGDGNRRWMGQCIARHPLNPDTLVCGEDWDGLFRSDDNGETWRCLGLQETRITDVHWDPDNPDRLYVCAPEGPMGRQIRPGDPNTRKTGFFRSDDGGATWRRSQTDDIPNETAQIPGSPRIVGIFGNRHVRASDDGGATWFPFEEGLPIAPNGTTVKGYVAAELYQTLATGPDFWLAGNTRGDIFRRGVGDQAWRRVPRDTVTLTDPVAEHHHVQRAANGEMWSLATLNVDPFDPAHWLATDWFDIWETLDAGRTWRSRVIGMSQLVPFAIACDPHSPDNILYGMADVGMSISHDGGRTFHGGVPTGGANSIAWSPATPGLAYIVGGKRGVQFLRTRDGGHKWDKPRGEGLPAFRTGTQTNAEKEFAAYTVAVDPVTDRVFLCVSGPSGPQGGGVWASSDQGETFTRLSEGLPEGRNLFKSWEFDGGGEAGWTPQLVFSPDGSAVLSILDGHCYSLDRAANRWEPTSLQNPWCSRTIAADPFRPGRFLSAQGAALSESTDGGRTWRDVKWQASTGRTRARTFGWCVAFDAHVPGLVVGANRDCILVSRDGGATFDELPDGLNYPTGVRRCLVVDRGRLFGLTRGSGVWTRDIDGLGH